MWLFGKKKKEAPKQANEVSENAAERNDKKSSAQADEANEGYKNNLKNCETAAVQGDAEAQFECAEMYFYGKGVKKDRAAALKWYEMAAEQGHKEAQLNCGKMYGYGWGTDQDVATACMWLNKAKKNSKEIEDPELEALFVWEVEDLLDEIDPDGMYKEIDEDY